MASPHFASEPYFDVHLHPAPADVVKEFDTWVTMRDGIKLCANVFRPQKPGKYPVIMSTTPYGKNNFNEYEYFEKNIPRVHVGHIEISDIVGIESPDPGFWVPNGYVVMHVDTRGQGESEGKTGPFSRKDEEDYYDLIEWAGAQQWSNGNVALSGVSYLAMSQWGVASRNPPHLKAIVPWEGVYDHYRWAYFGGILETGFRPWIWHQWIVPRHNKTYGYYEDNWPENATKHPVIDEYWRPYAYELEKITVPTLICASFSDQGLHSRDSFHAYTRISSRYKWLFNHRRQKWSVYYSEEAVAFQKRFLDHFLKGIDNGMLDVPRVRLEIYQSRTEYKVLHANDWPLEETRYIPLFLDARTRSLKPFAFPQESSISYPSDGSEAAVFELKFEHDTNVVGDTKLRLWVSTEEGDDMDLFVGLKKLDANGEEVFFYGSPGFNPNDIVARGWLRVSHRELDPEKSRPWKPYLKHERILKIKPGEIVPVEIEVLPHGTTFKKDETLRLVVQGASIDHLLIKLENLNRGRHRIYTGGRFDSHLLVPIV